MILSIEQWSGIFSALIQVIGVFFTVFVGFIQFKKNKWSENVSKERTIWLKEFRQEVGKIMKAYEILSVQDCYKCCACKNNNKKNIICGMNEVILEAEEARYVLITRINTNKFEGNEYNFRYKEILKEIKFDKTIKESFNKDEFLDLTNLILETEWQKIKRESRGKNE